MAPGSERREQHDRLGPPSQCHDGCGRAPWNPDSWDRYEASQWQTVADWLAANPDDPDHEAMRRYLDENRRLYLRWGRRYLGWGVFVTRPR